jgi:hypothetical protein
MKRVSIPLQLIRMPEKGKNRLILIKMGNEKGNSLGTTWRVGRGRFEILVGTTKGNDERRGALGKGGNLKW